jgi:Zn-dependent peptidase ImmA (M78 family)
MPKENIPEVLRPFVRCPIYYTIDDRSDKVKEKLIQRDIERQRRAFGDKIVDEDYQQSIRDEYYHTAPGFSYIPHLDIIIMPHWEEDNYYKTTLAHEVAHSILHQKTESTNEEENEKEYKKHEVEADQFVLDHFQDEPWLDLKVLHHIQAERNSK